MAEVNTVIVYGLSCDAHKESFLKSLKTVLKYSQEDIDDVKNEEITIVNKYFSARLRFLFVEYEDVSTLNEEARNAYEKKLRSLECDGLILFKPMSIYPYESCQKEEGFSLISHPIVLLAAVLTDESDDALENNNGDWDRANYIFEYIISNETKENVVSEDVARDIVDLLLQTPWEKTESGNLDTLVDDNEEFNYCPNSFSGKIKKEYDVDENNFFDESEEEIQTNEHCSDNEKEKKDDSDWSDDKEEKSNENDEDYEHKGYMRLNDDSNCLMDEQSDEKKDYSDNNNIEKEEEVELKKEEKVEDDEKDDKSNKELLQELLDEIQDNKIKAEIKTASDNIVKMLKDSNKKNEEAQIDIFEIVMTTLTRLRKMLSETDEATRKSGALAVTLLIDMAFNESADL